MMNVKLIIYTVYKRIQNNWVVATISSFLYVRLFLSFRQEQPISLPTATKLPKIAFICDEMTWQDFRNECCAVFITPRNWLEVLRAFQPDLFFCESAWSGIEDYKDCWRGQIYRNKQIRYQNRRTLFQILEYCEQQHIPTVFWNKEDPTFYGNETYDFVDTALRFQHIFTTATECVPLYEQRGHNSVHTLMFGFSPRLFHLPESEHRDNIAVFAGSWYADQPERCRDLAALFDLVLEQCIGLVIYDRQSASSNPIHRFPEKYQPYLRPSVPFQTLGDIFCNVKYAININTVKDSETMFARRVFEIMACGCVVISNDSTGLKQLFPGRIWLLGETWDSDYEAEVTDQNATDVQQNHTIDHRLKEILHVL